MKKIYAVAAALAIMLASGCVYTAKTPGPRAVEPAVQSQRLVGAFNDEQYIWTEWIFSTNRVDDAKK